MTLPREFVLNARVNLTSNMMALDNPDVIWNVAKGLMDKMQGGGMLDAP